MTPSRRSFILGTAAAAAAAPALAQEHSGAPQVHHSSSFQDDFAAQMREQMRVMVETIEQAPMTGDPDRDFLAMMIPHHQGAIDMARLVLTYGRDPLTRQLAEEIVASQRTEIGSMKARLDALDRLKGGETESFPALTGTRGIREP
jgi:uncharacterized protein (DUF305 family)